MKALKKLIYICCIVAAVYLFCLHVVVGIKGKSLLVDKLEQAFGRQVSVGNVKTSLPANVVVRDIEVKDVFKIKEIFLRGGVIDIFRKGLILSEVKIDQAIVNVKRSPSEQVKQTDQATPKAIESEAQTSQGNPTTDQSPFLPSLSIRKLIISNSMISFVDQRTEGQDIKITVKDLSLDLKDLNFPIAQSNITTFTISGRLPWREGDQEGRLSATGWINILKKDMQAELEIMDIDGVYLYPYYANWFDLEKSRISQANLQFKSKLTALDNDLVADCSIELTDVVFRAKKDDESDERIHRIAETVLNIFKTMNKGLISLNFTIRTKLDRPEFGYQHIRSAFEAKVAKGIKAGVVNPQDLVVLPIDFVNGVVSGATDLTKSIIERTTELGRVLIDAFKVDQE